MSYLFILFAFDSNTRGGGGEFIFRNTPKYALGVKESLFRVVSENKLSFTPSAYLGLFLKINSPPPPLVCI